MGISESRDSTPTGLLIVLLDWAIAAVLALAVLVFLAGIDVRIGGVTVRSHSAIRVIAAAAALILLRIRFGIDSHPRWLMRITLLVAICGSVEAWLRFLLATIGGADSYGYVSASRMIASGRLIDAAPIAEWLTAPNRMAIASPLGWTPSPDGTGIAPTFPIGVSAMMALFTTIGGAGAAFFVAPVTGVITLWLVYRLAREWVDPETSLFAAAMVAWNPLFITYAKQPMSDMPATMWIALALLLAVQRSNTSAVFAGLAAGAAVITRPALLIAAAVMPLVAHRGESPKRRLMFAALGLGIGVVIQMAIQQQLFGSPFATGYGAAGNLFSLSHVVDNLKIFFGRNGWDVAGPLFIPGLIIGIFASRPDPREKPAMVFVAVLLPYLFYLPFDHWETLRFLLPGIVPLTIVVADGLMHIARMPRNAIVTTVAIAAFMAIVAGRSESLLRKSSVWEVASLEERYPLAGDWINVNTPADSVVLANQHSGSLRWYGHRQTLRWDFVEPNQLAKTIDELQSHGATVYVALEGDEVAMFDERFAGVIDQLQVDHVGRVRNVSFLRLRYLPPNR
ncbi:MAG TPA: glycosyltransferase family 39 protein [Vicinamibacterales bacterium]|nr:glycosyltransferase family 39 protein [Vicinamibacterales bacterium]